MKKVFTAGVLALSLSFGGVAFADEGGDAAAGAKVFKKYCKMCHNKDGSKSSMAKDIRGTSKEAVEKALKGESEGLSPRYATMVKAIKKRHLEGEAANLAAFLKK